VALATTRGGKVGGTGGLAVNVRHFVATNLHSVGCDFGRALDSRKMELLVCLPAMSFCSRSKIGDLLMKQSSLRLAIAAGVLAVTAASGASAQVAGWYVSGDVGQSNNKTSSSDIGILGGSFDRKDTQSAFAIGAQFNKSFGLEIGYADFGKAKVSGAGAVPCRPANVCTLAFFPVSGDVRAKATHISLVSSVSLTENLSLYGRIGASRTDRSASVRVNNVTVSSGEKKTEALIGVGFAYAITPNVDATLEWKKLNNTDVDAVSAGVRLRF
jgi:opacity protein-like surface antigen